MTIGLPIRFCRGCGCTDRRPCTAGCSWVDIPSELVGALCSECAYLIVLVDAGLVVGDEGHICTLPELGDDLEIDGIARIAEQLATTGVVVHGLPVGVQLRERLNEALGRRPDTRPVLQRYQARVRKELDDQAAEEMTVHVLEFPDQSRAALS